MNDLTGLQAICVALAQPEASFNFNPLIVSPRRSIEPSLQRAVSELFGCWDESALQIESAAGPASLDTQAATAPRTLSGRRSELLALPPGPSSWVQKRSLLLVAAVVIVVGLSTVIAVTGGFNNNQVATAPLPQAQTPAAPVATQAEPPKASLNTVARANRPERKEEKRARSEEKSKTPAVEAEKEPEQGPQSVKVVMQIENGRVLKASIANPKPGMDSYEALALRIARQRRFPTTTSGAETVTISVNK
jgi:cytoskeletal protein RodZ